MKHRVVFFVQASKVLLTVLAARQ